MTSPSSAASARRARCAAARRRHLPGGAARPRGLPRRPRDATGAAAAARAAAGGGRAERGGRRRPRRDLRQRRSPRGRAPRISSASSRSAPASTRPTSAASASASATRSWACAAKIWPPPSPALTGATIAGKVASAEQARERGSEGEPSGRAPRAPGPEDSAAPAESAAVADAAPPRSSLRPRPLATRPSRAMRCRRAAPAPADFQKSSRRARRLSDPWPAREPPRDREGSDLRGVAACPERVDGGGLAAGREALHLAKLAARSYHGSHASKRPR